MLLHQQLSKSLIAVVLIPKSGIFQVKFGVVMLGSRINLRSSVVVVVMKDARCYLYPRMSSVLSKSRRVLLAW